MPNWWNLDSHLAKVIASELRNFVEKSHGYPGGSTPEEWNIKLSNIAQKLETYDTRYDAVTIQQEMQIIEQAQEALREFAEVFPALWD